MKSFISICLVLFIHCGVSAQTSPGEYVSPRDSIRLVKFWNGFRQSIARKDKASLESLFSFPFYCSPCKDYVRSIDTAKATIRVNRTLFRESVYKLFFDMPAKNPVIRNLEDDEFVIYPGINDRGQRDGFVFTYTISAPHDGWEGVRGVVYLKWFGGKFVITGIESVP